MYVGLMMLGGQKYTAEPLVADPITFEFEMAIEN